MANGKETPEALFERVILRLRTEGFEKAVDALISVCGDDKAVAPARATAGVALLRANGVLADKTGARKTKELAEMDGEELQAEIDRLKRQAQQAVERLERPDEDEEEDETEPGNAFS
ncbi:hypothetical protein [Aminobacter niigataensis]|uniref:hypothetical protein n=1 Tax=Aminobacter niigataensis TaxID=83265 RepID=UPI0024C6B7D0|nr:hypothetical protein [Aminobacter niigataensis]CAI2931886.1 conserved protein of unknown function [Aminobacter niigataensis]